MLIDKKIGMRWNSKNKKFYEEKGYIFTKMKDKFMVNVEDLKDGSNEKVRVICDNCGKEYNIFWYHKVASRKLNGDDLDYCHQCPTVRQKKTMIEKYGVEHPRQISEVNEKIAKTNIEKYGHKNPFGSKEIKEKIVSTNIKKYGAEHHNQTEEGKKARRETNLRKYGYTTWSANPENRKKLSGKNSPSWKGGIEKYNYPSRYDFEYREWRTAVFTRDNYTCQKCGKKAGRLQAHHIKNWKHYVADRYKVSNGITFCIDCHRKFHSQYGLKRTNINQLNNFLQQ